MSPIERISQVSGETGISVRVILTLAGLLIGLLTTVSGVGVAGIIKIDSIHYDIQMLRLYVEGEIEELNDELTRRTISRWTSEDMMRLQQATERALQQAGLDAKLPDPYGVKR